MIDLSLLEDFILGAGESLEEMEAALLSLETDPENKELLDTIFRDLHTIKGAAQFVGLDKVAELSHVAEDLLDAIRTGEKAATLDIITVLMHSKDRVEVLIEDLERSQTEETEVADLVEKLSAYLNTGPTNTDTTPSTAEAPASNELEEFQDEELSFFLDEEPRKEAAEEEGNELSFLSADSSFLEAGESIKDATDTSFLEIDIPESQDTDDSFLNVEIPSTPSIGFLDVEGEESTEEDSSEIFSYLPTDATEEQTSFLADDSNTESISSSSEVSDAPEEDLTSTLLEGFDNLDASFDSTASSDPGLAIQANEVEEDLTSTLMEGLDNLESSFDSTANPETDAPISAEPEIEAPDLSTEPELSSEQPRFELPEEEHDQELFGIFIQQLQDKLSLINEVTQSLAITENKAESLTPCIETIKALKFSSNYMGYEALTNLYSVWLSRIDQAQSDLLMDAECSLEFMHTYLQELNEIFPQLHALSSEKNTDEITVSAIDNLAADEGHLAFIEGLIEDEQPQDDKTPEKIIEPVEKPTIAKDPAPSFIADIEAKEEDDEEDQLFKRLSSALDSSIQESIVADPINEVFDALLAASEIESPAVQAIQPLKIKTLEQANLEIIPEPESPEPVAEVTAKVETISELDIQTLADQQELEAAVQLGIQDNQPAQLPATKKADKAKTAIAPKKQKATEKVFKKSIRIDSDKIDSLMNQVGELIVNRASFFQLAGEIVTLQQDLKESGLAAKELKLVRAFAYRFGEAIISLGRTSNELQEGVMTVRMLPIAQLFNRYPRLVHDLAHTHHKKIELLIRGESTELDKMIIEELSDPIIHMIRNAIGHGLETPEQRRESGKPETGTLTLEAYHESNHIVIEVRDDGRGIDPEKIRAKALAKGLFSSEELARMNSKELNRFIMMPGFSTADKIDSTSGRGVGMDVVKKNIEKLNGSIEVDSKLGISTTIRLKIPLTLAIIPALLVRVSTNFFTVPLANVEETLRVNRSNISVMEDTEVMYLRGKTIPIFRLSHLFSIPSDLTRESLEYFVVIVNTGAGQVGFMVDELLGQEEVVIKPLADYLQDNSGFSGATIIGGGRISLIIDVNELSNIAKNSQIEKHQDQESKSLASLDLK
ncbi:MAG: hypothetical protein GQ582_01865 [Methyloprofundus sp.]|nr:hypothetical protein [Methyloprofundus sp.]